MTNPLYETSATARGGRNGHVRTEDGTLDLDVRLPGALGGAGDATNPEQLFAAGYSACFDNAVLHIARAQKTALPEASSTTVHVALVSAEGGAFELQVRLDVHLPGMSQHAAEALANAAHATCPYSRAIRGNVDATLTVRTDAPAATTEAAMLNA